MRAIIAALLTSVLIGWSGERTVAQTPKTENVVIVTIDGLRWQELFQGVDPDVLSKEKYVRNRELVHPFTRNTGGEKRGLLMPFMWSVVATHGQLYGNRDLGNEVNCTNRHLISYPGYSEMLLGFRDRRVSSNERIEDSHPTVLEAIAKDYRFADEVAAFATWDAFNFILREEESNIYVNAGNETAQGDDISVRERMLNELVETGKGRNDSITFLYAMEYLKRVRPRVTFIGFDGTDHHAHKGRYDQYLLAAHDADRMIGQLWTWLQSQPDYKDRTTLLITTDHGRGNRKHNWRRHRLLTRGSRHIWFAALGPDTPAFGEMKIQSRMYQKQTAGTIAAFLGLPYQNREPVGEVIQTMISIPAPEDVMSVFSQN